MQQQIFAQFNYDRFQRSQSARAAKARLQKVATTLELSTLRETQVRFFSGVRTQSVDAKLAEILKSNLHILLSIGARRSPNFFRGKHCVPPNQMVETGKRGEA